MLKLDIKNIDLATAKMLRWLETWNNGSGAYNGYVVHRHDLKRLSDIHDTPWSQAPIIQGLNNLYRTTKCRRYYELAKQAVGIQLSRLNRENGQYSFAGFEDDRFSSLVHNSLANCGVLDFAFLLKEEGCEPEFFQEILDAVSVNLDKYFFGVLWNEKIGAFKFSEIDYYWPKEDRFVANMNSVAVEALLRFYELTGEEKYYKSALRVGNWLLTQTIHSEDSCLDGSVGYAQTHPGWVISIYTALALRGVDDLYKYTGDDKYKTMMTRVVEHLLKFSENGLFYHANYNGVMKQRPFFLAGAGIILKAIDDVNHICGTDYDLSPFIKRILDEHLSIGGFQTFRGYHSLDNNRKKANPKLQVWEDVVPVVAWNAHFFELLTRYVTAEFNDNVMIKSVIKCRWNYFYLETQQYFLVISGWPYQSAAVLLYKKKCDKSLVSFTFGGFYKKIKGSLLKKNC